MLKESSMRGLFTLQNLWTNSAVAGSLCALNTQAYAQPSPAQPSIAEPSRCLPSPSPALPG